MHQTACSLGATIIQQSQVTTGFLCRMLKTAALQMLIVLVWSNVSDTYISFPSFFTVFFATHSYLHLLQGDKT